MALDIKRSNYRTYYAIILAVGMFFFSTAHIHAATLQVSPSATTVSPGGILTLSVSLNSEGVAINNAEAKIIFPADMLEVVSINKSSSLFTLWVEEPSYSNSTGIITFNGGIPTPGFNGPYGTALSIVVKAKKAGQADILISDAAVRANDGLGTNVLTGIKGATLRVVAKAEQPADEIQTPAPSSSVASLVIASPTHPSQESWYKDASPLFRWKIPAGVDAVQTSIDATTSGLPRVTYSPAISEKSVTDLKDGIWYFKVRARKDGQWSPVSTYIARIDSVAPKNNSVAFNYDDRAKVLHINADIIDETSGVDYYELYLNDTLAKKVPAAEFVKGSYDLPISTSGDVAVKLVAVDRAGNNVDALGTFHATPIINDSPQSVQPVASTDKQMLVTIGSFAMPVLYFVVLLISIVLLLVLGAFKLGNHYSSFYHKVRTRAALGKADNIKVLISLKKRLERHLELLQRTRHERVLSKEEKDIKQAIEGDLDEVDQAIEDQKGE